MRRFAQPVDLVAYGGGDVFIAYQDFKHQFVP